MVANNNRHASRQSQQKVAGARTYQQAVAKPDSAALLAISMLPGKVKEQTISDAGVPVA